MSHFHLWTLHRHPENPCHDIPGKRGYKDSSLWHWHFGWWHAHPPEDPRTDEVIL